MSNFTETHWCFHILSRTQISIKEGGKRVSHSILCSVPWEEFLKSISLIFGLLSSPHLTPLSWWIYELLIVVSFECRLTCFCFILFTANVLVSLETANSITSRKRHQKMDALLAFPHLFAVCCYFVSNKYSTTVHCVANLRGYFDASARKERHWAKPFTKVILLQLSCYRNNFGSWSLRIKNCG